jgi:PPM family protein phosphatase
VVEQAARTDTGRQRAANEDAYFVRSPAFAVADGMGGAQAGEVAARIAADAFEGSLVDGENPEQRLSRVASDANTRIFELSRSDSSRSGMGTTLTGALVSGDEVSIVHVGDSRAYLLRDGELRQLTRDHSLVEELRRRGQLTHEEAEEHPQRSIITRALGPERNVEIDVHTHQARRGDVFVLCSDGLTTMVREERMHQILARSESLAQAVDALVNEANRMGGRDNITVVAFRVGDARKGDGAAAAVAAPEPAESDTAERTATKLDSREVRRALRRERRAERRAERPTRRRLKIGIAALATLLVLGGLAIGARAAIRSVYFVGQNEQGLVTLYRGVPYDLPAGVELYDTEYVSSVRASRLRPFERRRLFDHELRSRDDAADLVRRLEQGR